jgi:hypothetical protein
VTKLTGQDIETYNSHQLHANFIQPFPQIQLHVQKKTGDKYKVAFDVTNKTVMGYSSDVS